MQIPPRARIALVALVSLASHADCCDRPVSLAEIAADRNLSPAYLEQVFARLRRAGLVASARGPSGGYRLTRPAHLVKIADIIRAMDDPPASARVAPVCRLSQAMWDALHGLTERFLVQVTLEDVVRHDLPVDRA